MCTAVHAFQLRVPMSPFGTFYLKKKNFIIYGSCSGHYISFIEPSLLGFVFSSLFATPMCLSLKLSTSSLAEAREGLIRIAWKCSLATIFSACNAACYYLTSFLWDKGVPEQDE